MASDVTVSPAPMASRAPRERDRQTVAIMMPARMRQAIERGHRRRVMAWCAKANAMGLSMATNPPKWFRFTKQPTGEVGAWGMGMNHQSVSPCGIFHWPSHPANPTQAPITARK